MFLLRGAETDREVCFGHACFGNAWTCWLGLSASPTSTRRRLAGSTCSAGSRNAITVGMRIRANSWIHGCGGGDRMALLIKLLNGSQCGPRELTLMVFLDRSGCWQPSFSHPQF